MIYTIKVEPFKKEGFQSTRSLPEPVTHVCSHVPRTIRRGAKQSIDLPEDNPETFELILRYLYAGSFTACESLSTVSDNNTATEPIADNYLIAEKFQGDF